MTEVVLNLYKKIGETPLERLERLRVEQPKYASSVLSYAGRLDPMACGVLLVLVDEGNYEREKYLTLEKEYKVNVLFGCATDTYDTLGLVSEVCDMEINRTQLKNVCSNSVGLQRQTYPPYSSKMVKGKPLFWWAREDRIHEIELPSHDIEVHSVYFSGLKTIGANELMADIASAISRVRGDFRQKKVMNLWYKTFSIMETRHHHIARLTLHVSSGTYMRSFAHELGKKLGGCALALSIVRTRVGDYHLVNSMK